ncbi:MAG: hypothetical protein K0Q50_70 [Vampirovibrio sp.]|jgi:NodT family efflux transporter outer membrane factor (OMF) lipoprotein|nr:hypothetical protein [Vampirovibrio sp.]
MKAGIYRLISSLLITMACLPIPASLAASPPEKPTVPTLPQWAEQSESASTGTPLRLQAEFPDQQWWNLFNDAYLPSYINGAIQNNPSLNIAAERVIQARALVRQNVALELPSVDVNPSYYHIGLPQQGAGVGVNLPRSLNFYSLPLQASYELDLWGRNLDQIRSSKRQMEATEFQSKTVLTGIISEVASAYVNLLRADALIRTQQENLALLNRIEELKRSQNQAGLTSYDEVIRAERDTTEAESQLAKYQQQQAVFAHQLSVLTGTSPSPQAQLQRGSLEELALPVETQVGIPSELLARRPDLLAQEKLLESAHLDVSVARKAFLPKINLGAFFVMGALDIHNLFDWGNLVNVQSAVVNQPLFKGGKLKAELKYRKSKQKEQLENYRQTILNAFKDVEDSIALLKADSATLEANQKRLLLTEKNLGLTQSLAQQGLVPRLNTLQSQSEVIRYRQLAMQSKADKAIDTISLYKALGGGF